jgi:hypothetical protein
MPEVRSGSRVWTCEIGGRRQTKWRGNDKVGPCAGGESDTWRRSGRPSLTRRASKDIETNLNLLWQFDLKNLLYVLASSARGR